MDRFTTENVDVATEDDVVTLTITRQESRNSMNTDTVLDLLRALNAVELQSDVVAVVLTGEGDQAFSSGADIAQHAGPADEEFQKTRNAITYELYTRIRELHPPVIARINGHCVGGGLGLAIYSDVRLGVPGAKFGIPPVNIGEIPTAGATHRLVELIGEPRTKELVLTATLVDGERALRMGLIDRLVEPDELDAEVETLLDRIHEAGPNAVKNAKRLINRAADTDRDEARDAEVELWWDQFDSEERRRLVEEFMED